MQHRWIKNSQKAQTCRNLLRCDKDSLCEVPGSTATLAARHAHFCVCLLEPVPLEEDRCRLNTPSRRTHLGKRHSNLSQGRIAPIRNSQSRSDSYFQLALITELQFQTGSNRALLVTRPRKLVVGCLAFLAPVVAGRTSFARPLAAPTCAVP